MSENALPQRFTKIDELTLLDHAYLNSGDECYFLGEYAAREGYTYSDTNNFILNLKKGLGRRDRPEWKYKEKAILEAAIALDVALGMDDLSCITFVPMPPSLHKDDPLYDDRIIKILYSIPADRVCRRT